MGAPWGTALLLSAILCGGLWCSVAGKCYATWRGVVVCGRLCWSLRQGPNSPARGEPVGESWGLPHPGRPFDVRQPERGRPLVPGVVQDDVPAV